MLKKRRRKRKKKQTNKNNITKIIKKISYKIDNKYQKAKIKNLGQSLEFQKYNAKEQKKKKNKVTKIIKNTYIKFVF